MLLLHSHYHKRAKKLSVHSKRYHNTSSVVLIETPIKNKFDELTWTFKKEKSWKWALNTTQYMAAAVSRSPVTAIIYCNFLFIYIPELCLHLSHTFRMNTSSRSFMIFYTLNIYIRMTVH